jgi:uncharacterized protein YciI
MRQLTCLPQGDTVKTKSLVAAALLFASVCCPAQSSAPENPGIPKGMKHYFIGFLVKGPKYDTIVSKDERAQLFEKHIAYIRSQAEAGKYKLAGPFVDDGNIGGILIIDTPTEEEAKQIVAGDPMVQAGRMAPEIHPAMLADLSCVLPEYKKNGGQ